MGEETDRESGAFLHKHKFSLSHKSHTHTHTHPKCKKGDVDNGKSKQRGKRENDGGRTRGLPEQNK